MATRKGTDLDGAKGNSRSDKVKITDLINLYKFPEKKWVTGRLYGDIHSYATGWVRGKNKEGKAIKFPVNMPSYDPETQQFDSTKYDPWYEIYESEKGVERDDQTVQVGRKFYGNWLSRSQQRQKPSTISKPTAAERKSGFKDKDSDTWTPWVPYALPPGVITKIQELKGLNVVESRKTGSSKTYSVAHEKFGCDIRIYFDSSKAPGDQYQVQLGDRTPLTEEELAFLRWDTSNLAEEVPEDEVRRDFESWAKRVGYGLKKKAKKDKGRSEEDEDEDDDLDDEPPKSKAKSKTSSKAKRPEPEDEDDEPEDEEDDDLEDDDPPPKSKSKKPAPKSKKPVDEDGDDLDDDDLDDDEDDEPAPKSKAKSKPKTSSKSKREEPEEDEDGDDDSSDDDDDLDDDDDDEPPPKSKAKSKTSSKTKKPVDEDEDDDLDDDDTDPDDEDDEPPKSKSKVKSKKPVDEDDDDLDDDDDEPAPKKPVKRRK